MLMKPLLSDLLNLLSIHSPSGEETGVITYITPVLRPLCDVFSLDSYGNIKGEIKCGPEPYTVLLNAHMDTVARIKPVVRYNRRRQTVHTLSNSALGGDDKCGLAVHLDVVRNIKRSSFSGTLKILFTREEEIGCVGASHAIKLDPEWFEDIDAAIVVDRREGDNIVSGGWDENFCSPEYEGFWEEMAEQLGFRAFSQDGTISDTMCFAELGINSVNLSAGYYNAHTKDEYIKVHEVYRTAKWVLTALDNIQQRDKFPSFNYERERKWGFNAHRDFWLNYKWDDELDTIDVDYCDYCGDECPLDDLHVVANGQYKICNPCVQFIYRTEEDDADIM